jgi:hypothetical protein
MGVGAQLVKTSSTSDLLLVRPSFFAKSRFFIGLFPRVMSRELEAFFLRCSNDQ